jgi:MFS family permease
MIGIGALIHASMIPIANTMFLTIFQTKVPSESQGRVFSFIVSTAAAVTPLGMLISGSLAEVFGIVMLFILSLYLQFAVLVLTWFFTSIKSVIEKERIALKAEKGKDIRIKLE